MSLALAAPLLQLLSALSVAVCLHVMLQDALGLTLQIVSCAFGRPQLERETIVIKEWPVYGVIECTQAPIAFLASGLVRLI